MELRQVKLIYKQLSFDCYKSLFVCFVDVALVEVAAFHNVYTDGSQRSILCAWSGTCRV